MLVSFDHVLVFADNSSCPQLTSVSIDHVPAITDEPSSLQPKPVSFYHVPVPAVDTPVSAVYIITYQLHWIHQPHSTRQCYIYIFCLTSVRRNHWGRLAGTCSPVLVWNMLSSMEGENSLIRYESSLHFEWREVDGPIKPQDACCCRRGGRRRDC